MSQRFVRLERVVDAPPPRAYRMWSDADTLTSWLCSEVQGSLLPGAESIIVLPRRRIPVYVLEAIPADVFRFRWQHPEAGDLTTEVVVRFRPLGYGTHMTLEDGPFDDGDADQLDAWGEAIATWAAALVQLRAQVDFSVDLRARR